MIKLDDPAMEQEEDQPVLNRLRSGCESASTLSHPLVKPTVETEVLDRDPESDATATFADKQKGGGAAKLTSKDSSSAWQQTHCHPKEEFST